MSTTKWGGQRRQRVVHPQTRGIYPQPRVTPALRPPPPYSSLVFTTPYRPHDPKTRLASGSTMTRKHITHLKASCKSIASPGPRTSLLPVTWCPYTLQSRSGGVTSSSLPPPYLKIAPIDQQRFECLSHKSSVSSGRGVRTDPLATVRRDGLCRRRQSTS